MYIPIILYIQVSKTWGIKIRFKEFVSSLKRKKREEKPASANNSEWK